MGQSPLGGSECHGEGVFLSPQPLQALESYLLLRALCSALGDNLGTASALCHVTKLLFQLECPSYAQVSVTGREGDTGGPAGPRGRSPHVGGFYCRFSWRRASPTCRKPTAATIPTRCCGNAASCSAASCAASPSGYGPKTPSYSPLNPSHSPQKRCEDQETQQRFVATSVPLAMGLGHRGRGG